MNEYVWAQYSKEAIKLINKNIYEPILLELLNTTYFSGNLRYRNNNHQAKGESDYFDCVTGNQYDGKLLLFRKNKGQGKLLVENDAPLQWVNSLLSELHELGNAIANRMITQVSSSQLYQIMAEQIGSIKENEGCIFFFPFPISGDYEDSIYTQFGANELTLTYNQLISNHVLSKKKEVYAIYPALLDQVVVRKLHEGCTRIFIKTRAISTYMRYTWGNEEGPFSDS